MSKTFRIFVSSTFADLKAERDALQQFVFPRLRELCAQRGSRFQAIDLRWGISGEATLDQRVIPICFEEIDRCRRVSPRPNFIVLLGDRYGSLMPPPVIPDSEFEAICQHLGDEERALLEEWYRRDENAVQVERCLRRATDSEVGKADELREVLERGAVSAALPKATLAKYRDSVTHQEIDRGVFGRPGSHEHALAFFRTIENLDCVIKAMPPDTPHLRRFCDLAASGARDVHAQRRSQELKDRLRAHLDSADAYQYSATWIEDGTTSRTLGTDLPGKKERSPITTDHIGMLPDSLEECLELAGQDDTAETEQLNHTGLPRPVSLCRDVFRRLASMIQTELEAHSSADQLDEEIKAHWAFGAERKQDFVGRAAQLAAISQYLDNPQGRLLAIVGDSGTGKSALLAEAAHRASIARQRAHIVVRFIGATPGSSDGRSLLTSLWRQLARLYRVEDLRVEDLAEEVERIRQLKEAALDEQDFEKAARLRDEEKKALSRISAHRRDSKRDGTDSVLTSATVSTDFDQLVSDFPHWLTLATAEQPLILFLDALDQLSDMDGSRRLAWLPTQLSEHVAVVVSALPGQCEDALASKRAKRLDLLALPRAEGAQLLDEWLKKDGRTLQPHQWRAVLPEERDEVLPLWLKLSFEEARLWKSYADPAETPLPGDVDDLIRSRLFRRLGHEHGRVLVERGLGSLGAAKNGLSEDELVDLLSAGPVLDELKQRSPVSPVVDVLPVAVWSRLLFDLRPYLTERSADGIELLGFYHRQLEEIVAEVYLSDGKRLGRHRELAGYFAGQDLRWLVGGQSPNLRKMAELAFQQAHGALWADLGNTLNDLEFLDAKTACMGVDAVLGDLSLGVDHAEPSLQPIRRVLEREAHHLRAQEQLRLPNFFAQQVYNCAAASQLPAVAEAAQRRLVMLGKPYLALGWRTGGDALALMRPIWISSHAEPTSAMAVTPDGRWGIFAFGDGTLQVWDLGTTGTELHRLTHEGGVVAVAISADGRRAISTSGESGMLKVWNLDLGAELHTLNHENGAWTVAISSDGRQAISASDTLKVWDVATGAHVRTLIGHEQNVRALAIAPDGRGAVSASWDDTFRVWNLDSGDTLRTFPYESIYNRGNRGQDVAISADGRRAVSASRDDYDHFWILQVWDLERGGQLPGPDHGSGGRDLAVAITADGRRAVSASGNGTLKVWDFDTPRAEPQTFTQEELGTYDVALINGGRQAVTATSAGGSHIRVKTWELDAGSRLAMGHAEAVMAVAIASDGSRAVSVSSDGLKVWDLDTGTELPVFARKSAVAAQRGTVVGLSVTPDGQCVVCGGSDGIIKIWDLNTGALLEILVHTRGYRLDTFTISAGGRCISAVSQNILKVWDLHTGTVLRTLDLHTNETVDAAIITPDGRRAILGSRRQNSGIRVYDLDSGEQLLDLPQSRLSHFNVDLMAVAADNRRVIVALSSLSRDSMVRVWDLETLEELGTLAYFGRADALAVSPDSRRLACMSEDGALKIWDLDNYKQVVNVSLDARSCAAAVHGSRVVVGDANGAVHCFECVEP